MKDKRYIYIMVLFVVALIAVFASSYAFFESGGADTVVGNYEVIIGERVKFSVAGTTADGVTISDFAMFADGTEKIVYNDNKTVTISVENLIDTEAVNCTFDYVWRWDSTKSNYTMSTGATYEYMVSGPFTARNVPNYNADSFVLGNDTIDLTKGMSKNTKTVTINTKFYNLANIDQNGHAGKTYKGGVIVDNIRCK